MVTSNHVEEMQRTERMDLRKYYDMQEAFLGNTLPQEDKKVRTFERTVNDMTIDMKNFVQQQVSRILRENSELKESNALELLKMPALTAASDHRAVSDVKNEHGLGRYSPAVWEAYEGCCQLKGDYSRRLYNEGIHLSEDGRQDEVAKLQLFSDVVHNVLIGEKERIAKKEASRTLVGK